MLTIVATAYRIPAEIVNRFCQHHAGRPVWIVTDTPIAGLDGLTCIQAPEMTVFSITRCANIGIRAAIASGADIVCKTDIDCIITADAADFMAREVRPGRGVVFRYWGIAADKIGSGHEMLLPRIQGTCVMTAEDWRRCGGYDDRMDGYGFDDADIIRRAERSGITMPVLRRPKVFHIDHGEKHNRATCNPVRRDENVALATCKTA